MHTTTGPASACTGLLFNPSPKGWGYSRPLCRPGGNSGIMAGIKFGVPQPKPLHGFSPNIQGMFTPRESRADQVLGGNR